MILRGDNKGADFARYAAFIAANPSWPSIALFRRRAEAMLWAADVRPPQVLSFFKDCPPQTAKGRLVLARALTEQGDTDSSRGQVRQAWRSDPMSADLENQVLESYPEFLTAADHKARMEKSLYARGNETAIRAARRLGGADLAIADARVALAGKRTDAKRLLEAVSPEARNDAGYIFAYLQVLLHENKIAEAAKVMLSAPRDVAEIYDPEQWWIEREVLARKLLDIGDARSSYLMVRDAAEPTKEGSRVERHFMAGWIALRFLHDPAAAAQHFARIQKVSIHPTSLARSHYWLGRTAEAAHRPDKARAEYQTAALASTAYYGQLARAHLGLGTLALAPPAGPLEKLASVKQLELVHALEILYALNERTLVVSIMTVLGHKLDDVSELSALAEMAKRHQDARGMLQLGNAALARGLALDTYAFPTVGVPDYSPIGADVERAMLFAIIRQESAFNPDGLSNANAMGLMQLTPVAARDVCTRFKCTFDLKRLKSDTPYNLQLGVADLGDLIQYYRGNYILAFAAYNAGRGRVKEWIKQLGDPRHSRVDPIDWVERIPLTETRNYVQRVMENMQVYHVRFNATAPLTIEADLRSGAATH